MRHHLGTIREFTHGRTPPLLDFVIETASRDMRKISKRERFLNNKFP